LWWGEHAGWDFLTEKPIDKPAGDTHEFYRPWLLWDRSWQLAPEACRRFARGLWEHQVGDQRSGDFSRHAAISSHGPGTDAPYARHGGFYFETWATAYEKTGDEVFVRAIETVLDGLERARLDEGGYLVAGSKSRGSRRAYDLSLAVSLGNSAGKVPPTLAAKMREVASTNDKVFATAQAESPHSEAAAPGGSGLWSNAYGGGAPAGVADVCMLRYRQVGLDCYRQAVVRTADQYRGSQVDLSKPLWPGTLGDAVLLMLNAHELTEDSRYLDAADHFAGEALGLFFADGCPLPKASHVHGHYEAVTNGDTLMLALLRLWQVRHRPDLKLNLVYCDR
jgi:hypothetical protein